MILPGFYNDGSFSRSRQQFKFIALRPQDMQQPMESIPSVRAVGLRPKTFALTFKIRNAGPGYSEFMRIDARQFNPNQKLAALVSWIQRAVAVNWEFTEWLDKMEKSGIEEVTYFKNVPLFDGWREHGARAPRVYYSDNRLWNQQARQQGKQGAEHNAFIGIDLRKLSGFIEFEGNEYHMMDFSRGTIGKDVFDFLQGLIPFSDDEDFNLEELYEPCDTDVTFDPDNMPT